MSHVKGMRILKERNTDKMKNKVLTIFPPGWITTAPYLALPQLKGYANSLGENLDICDDNADFFDYIFSEDYLLKKLDLCQSEFEEFKKRRISLSYEELLKFQQLYRGLKYCHHFDKVDSLKEVLRSSKNEDEYMDAYKVFSSAQDLLGYCFNMTIGQNLISSNKYTENTIDNLFDFCDDKENNIFTEYYSDNRLIDKCLNYDFVGISITSTSQMLSTFTLIRLIRKSDPEKKLKLFLGGNFITRFIENADDDSSLIQILELVDFISIYEGEPLIENIFSPSFNFKKNNNVVYLDTETVNKNPVTRNVYTKTPILPDFGGLPLSKYMLPELVLPIISSKNCYNNCSFCTVPNGTFENKYIQFDFLTLVHNINTLSKKYNTKNFAFNDEVFALKRMSNFADAILRSKTDINWLCETRFDFQLRKEDFKKISDSGCKSIQFGLESYNQRILDLMKKNVDINDIEPIVNNALSAGISIHLFCILGFPKETEEEVLQTKNYAYSCLSKAKNEYNLPLTSIGYGTFGLEKGSDVYKNASDYGVTILDKGKQEYNYKYDYTVERGLSPERAEEIEQEMSGSNKLTTQIYTPENFVLCANSERKKSLKIHSGSLFVNRFFFDPFTGKKLQSCKCYYHKLDSDLVIASKNELGSLTKEEKGIFIHYGFLNNVEKSSLNHNNMYSLVSNPYCEVVGHETGNYTAYDKLTNTSFLLTYEFYSIIKLISEFSVKEFIQDAQSESFMNFDDIYNVLDEFYLIGLLVLA